ncbi:MAG: HdeD family acid-resistance protein [Chloroflexota bacterium]|jgi:uncharacterized membrane protein HdeD (DUF308 family)|nr:HdeD family acid-resistance protein [Chloroflexota bacterium]
MFSIIVRNWWVFLVRGLLAVIFGVLALIWPEITLITLMILFGIFVLMEGILNLVIGVATSDTNRRWWVTLIEGILDIVIAILTFVWPDITAVVLLYFIAAWALLSGVLEIILAIRIRQMIEREWAMILGGILSIIFSVLLFVFPSEGAISLLMLIGIYSIIIGILFVILGFRIRKFGREDQIIV